jgi:hypothetical protein
MSAPSTPAPKVRNRRVSVPIGETDIGSPAWLPMPVRALWAELPSLFNRPDRICVAEPGLWRMPELESETINHAEVFGRPSLGNSDPEAVEFAARAVDILGLSKYQLARRMFGSGSTPVDGTAKARTTRYVRAGRIRLAVLGVLPWAAFPDAPPPSWWTDPRFAQAIDEWRRQAATAPIARPDYPPTGAEIAAHKRQWLATGGYRLDRSAHWPRPPKSDSDTTLAAVASDPWCFSGV